MLKLTTKRKGVVPFYIFAEEGRQMVKLNGKTVKAHADFWLHEIKKNQGIGASLVPYTGKHGKGVVILDDNGNRLFWDFKKRKWQQANGVSFSGPGPDYDAIAAQREARRDEKTHETGRAIVGILKDIYEGNKEATFDLSQWSAEAQRFIEAIISDPSAERHLKDGWIYADSLIIFPKYDKAIARLIEQRAVIRGEAEEKFCHIITTDEGTVIEISSEDVKRRTVLRYALPGRAQIGMQEDYDM